MSKTTEMCARTNPNPEVCPTGNGVESEIRSGLGQKTKGVDIDGW